MKQGFFIKFQVVEHVYVCVCLCAMIDGTSRNSIKINLYMLLLCTTKTV